jgi:hypothetical protein
MSTNILMSEQGAIYIAEKMRLRFGAKFNKQWADVTKNGQELGKLIDEMREVFAGLTRGQVEKGLETMREKTYVPSLPEFRSWCVAVENQFTDIDIAYVNAANEKYHDAATYEAARRTGFYDLRARAESITKPTFKKHYEAVCAELLVNPKAFVIEKEQRIEQAPIDIVKKDKDFFEKLRWNLT